MVVSSADPRRSLLELVEPGWLDPELARALRHVRRRGVVARLRLQLDRAPGFACPRACAFARLPGARLRRRQVRPGVAAARMSKRAAMSSTAWTCSSSTRPMARTARASATRVVALLSEHWGDAQPQHERAAFAARAGGVRRLAGRPGAPRRAQPRPGAVDAAAARARALPHADRGPLAVRARRCIPARASPGAAGFNCAHEILRR